MVLKQLCRTGAAALIAALSLVPSADAQGLAGPYLAAQQADFRGDFAASARYYRRALAADPGNVGLMQNTVIAQIAAGQADDALPIATALAELWPENAVAGLILTAEAFAAGDFEAAESLLAAGQRDMNPLLAGLLEAWTAVGAGDFERALDSFDRLDGNDALRAYGQYHKALALALAGDFIRAEAILAGSDTDDGPLHLSRTAVLAHAEILAQIEREDEALALLAETRAGGVASPGLSELEEAIRDGTEVSFTRIRDAADGAAEAFLTLAAALNRDDADQFALLYARLAAHVAPDREEAHLIAADVLERREQFDLASAAYAAVPDTSPWYPEAVIGQASALRGAGEADRAIALLRDLAERFPDRITVWSALGDALRAESRFEEAAEAYGAAIERLGMPQRQHWPLYYSRAIAYERAGHWDAAEADFRLALELEPDQPFVLNYLGYSLVEQRRNLEEALEMIERAVAGEPDNGYIIDSLGWALYRLGRFEEAVEPMERAVALKPDDPIINDHLGDVYYKVGRRREAEFQWRRALSFGPADDLDMDRVRRKLEVGLTRVLEEEEEEDAGGGPGAPNGG